MNVKRVTNYDEHFERLLKLERKIFPRPVAACRSYCELMSEWAEKGRYFAWDVWDGDVCVGSTSLWIEKSRGGPLFATLNSSSLLPKYRGKGLYHRMLKVRIDFIKKLKLKFFEVQCSEKNEKMTNFWGKMVAAGKMRRMRSYFIPYYGYRSKNKMLEFRGYTKDWSNGPRET